jgi:predicted acylesterase/phospholipase RssA
MALWPKRFVDPFPSRFFSSRISGKGRYLVDGGLVNPVPTSIVQAMGADITLSVNNTTGPGSQGRLPRPSTFGFQSASRPPHFQSHGQDALHDAIRHCQIRSQRSRRDHRPGHVRVRLLGIPSGGGNHQNRRRRSRKNDAENFSEAPLLFRPRPKAPPSNHHPTNVSNVIRTGRGWPSNSHSR